VISNPIDQSPQTDHGHGFGVSVSVVIGLPRPRFQLFNQFFNGGQRLLIPDATRQPAQRPSGRWGCYGTARSL
jgi:hypothetical protein